MEKETFKPRENCILCEKPIHRSRTAGGGKRRRRLEDVTCCGKCSKTYLRISNFIRGKMRKAGYRIVKSIGKKKRDENGRNKKI